MKANLVCLLVALAAACWFVWRGHWTLAAFDCGIASFFLLSVLIGASRSSPRH